MKSINLNNIVFFVVSFIFIGLSSCNSSIQKEEEYLIKVNGGNYFCANKSKNYVITSDKTKAYEWEKFTIYFIDNHSVKIKTWFNDFVFVNEKGILQSNIDNKKIKSQTFKLVRKNNNRFNLYYLNNYVFINDNGYVQAGNNIHNKPIAELTLIKVPKNLRQNSEKTSSLKHIIGFLFISFLLYFIYIKINDVDINPSIIYLFSIVLFGYLIIRAINISFNIDEAMSYDILINKPYYFNALFFDDSKHVIANNHVLNTLFGYISYNLFGNSPFSFRLFNLLSFVIYSYFLIITIRLFSTKLITTLVAVCFCFLNPFMLEFFSLYRGYGLSLAFFSGVIYYFSRLFLEGHNNKLLLFGVTHSILAVYANFALIIPVFIFQLAYFIYLNKSNNIHQIIFNKPLIIMVCGGVLLIPAVSNILILSDYNELYFGGTESFIENTLRSIIEYTFYIKTDTDIYIIICILIFLFISGFLFYRNKKLMFFSLILLGIALLTTALHYIADSKFVIERASLYFVPLLSIFFMLIFDNRIKLKTIRIVFKSLIFFLSISAVVKGISSYNFFSTTTWHYDNDNKKILKDILKFNNDKDFSVGVFWIFESAFYYYSDYYNVDQLKKIKRLGSNKIIEEGMDFYYLRKIDLNRVDFNYLVLKEYDNSETILIKKSN